MKRSRQIARGDGGLYSTGVCSASSRFLRRRTEHDHAPPLLRRNRKPMHSDLTAKRDVAESGVPSDGKIRIRTHDRIYAQEPGWPCRHSLPVGNAFSAVIGGRDVAQSEVARCSVRIPCREQRPSLTRAVSLLVPKPSSFPPSPSPISPFVQQQSPC